MALTDPAPPASQAICAEWRLALEPAVALVDREKPPTSAQSCPDAPSGVAP